MPIQIESAWLVDEMISRLSEEERETFLHGLELQVTQDLLTQLTQFLESSLGEAAIDPHVTGEMLENRRTQILACTYLLSRLRAHGNAKAMGTWQHHFGETPQES